MRTYPKEAHLSHFCLSAVTLLVLLSCTACVENTITREKGTPIENPQADTNPLNTSVGSNQSGALARNGLGNRVDTKLGKLGRQSQSAYDAINNATPSETSAYDAINNATPDNTTASPISSDSSSSQAPLTEAEITRFNQTVDDATNELIMGNFEKSSDLAQELIKLSPRVSAKSKGHYVGFVLMASCLAEKGEKEKARVLFQRQLTKAEDNGVTEVVQTVKERLKEL